MKTTTKTIITLGAALLLAGTATAQNLNHPDDRMTDDAINADYETYERQQNEIKLLNDAGASRVASYSLAKAQCWLDVSFHEYTRNDRGPFPQAALNESYQITEYLKRGKDPKSSNNPAQKTPLVNNASKLRDDLWERTASIRSSPGASCVARELACAEVELVHAGNEYDQQQWRHAKPYVQIAEDLVGQASLGAKSCQTSVASITPAATPTPIQELSLQANVLFNFDRYDMANARQLTVQRLEKTDPTNE